MNTEYNDRMSPDMQITMEEMIAGSISEKLSEAHAAPAGYVDEEDLAQMGRDILKAVLLRFRPDLFE